MYETNYLCVYVGVNPSQHFKIQQALRFELKMRGLYVCLRTEFPVKGHLKPLF